VYSINVVLQNHPTSSTKSKKHKKMIFFVRFSFFASYKAMIAFVKLEPARLEEIIISLDFVAKCVNFFLKEGIIRFFSAQKSRRVHIIFSISCFDKQATSKLIGLNE
jgi:hypothetical protein